MPEKNSSKVILYSWHRIARETNVGTVRPDSRLETSNPVFSITNSCVYLFV